MKHNKYLFILILGLSIISGGLIIWRVFFYQKTTPEIIILISPTPTQTQIISPFPTSAGQEIGDSQKEIIDSLKKKFPLVEFVPFETDNFRVDYQAPLSLKVIVKKGDKLATKSLVESWIKSKGVNPATHQIKYFTPELSPAL